MNFADGSVDFVIRGCLYESQDGTFAEKGCTSSRVEFSFT